MATVGEAPTFFRRARLPTRHSQFYGDGGARFTIFHGTCDTRAHLDRSWTRGLEQNIADGDADASRLGFGGRCGLGNPFSRAERIPAWPPHGHALTRWNSCPDYRGHRWLLDCRTKISQIRCQHFTRAFDLHLWRRTSFIAGSIEWLRSEIDLALQRTVVR